MPGPLPKAAGSRRRRNSATIPTTRLPVSGRAGKAPQCPYRLDAFGAQWWAWAWKLPQACAWSEGDLYVVARRALLEDAEASPATAREQRELDDRLGLTPKGRAALRWEIVAEESHAAASPPKSATKAASSRRTDLLRLVDST